MDEGDDEIGSMRRIIGFDWLISTGASVLHTPADALSDDEVWDVFDGGLAVRFACGRAGSGARVPGVFERMGTWRCKRCCARVGLPPGKGSPKNDSACRAILGLDDS